MSDPATERDRADTLLGELIRFWGNGIRLSEDDLFFLESGFGIIGPDELEQFLNREDDPDRETLMERVLFPEDSLRRVLEPIAGCRGVGADIESVMAQLLSAACPLVHIRHPEKKVPIHAGIAPSQAERFVSRLFLSRSLSGEICRALHHFRPEAEAFSCRIMMRCRNMDMTPEKEALLIHFIREFPEEYPGFDSLFRLCLSLIADAPASKDPAVYLRKRRRQEKHLLRQIHRFEEERDRYGMEYLMMSRFQVPPESPEEVAARLAQMDVIVNEILCLPLLPEEMVRHQCFLFPDGLKDPHHVQPQDAADLIL